MRSRGTFRFWKRAPSFTIGLTFRFADYTFAPLEQGGEFFYEFVQPFVARIKMQTHGGLFVSGAKLRRNTSRALFNKAL